VFLGTVNSWGLKDFRRSEKMEQGIEYRKVKYNKSALYNICE